jgi:multicomponent Na+:H+ antiporter subunit D
MPAWPLAWTWAFAVIAAAMDGRRRAVLWLSGAALGVLFALDLALIVQTSTRGTLEVVTGHWPAGVGIRLRADVMSGLFAASSTLVLFAALLHEASRAALTRTFPALVLFMAAGLHGLFFTGDAFNFYVFFEVSMTAAFALVTHGHGAPKLRVAHTFIVVNLLGSVIFLAAVGELYQVSGTLDLRQIAEWARAQPSGSLSLLGALVLAAFSLKLGLFPFHFWLPPAYRDSRPAVAAILAGALANIGSYGLLRFGADVLQGELRAGAPALLVIGSASALYGAFLALTRRGGAEVVAYSAISHAGYILVALGLGRAGLLAALLLSLSGALDKATLFLALESRGTLARFAFLAGATSAVGIPLTVGFVGKAALLKAAAASAHPFGTVAVVVIAGVLSMLYMYRVYLRSETRALEAPGPAAVPMAALVAAVVVGLSVWPEPVLKLAAQVATTLEEGG